MSPHSTPRSKPRRSALRAVAAGCAAACALAFLPAAQAQEMTKIRYTLDWRFEGPATPFLMAAAKGYYKDEKLDVTIDAGTGSPAGINRVATGTHDIGLGDITSLFEFYSNNQQNPSARIQAIYVLYEQSPAMAFALKKSGIKSPKDLEGKTLGAPVFDGGRKAFPIFAKAVGIDMGKIKWQTMEPALRETMLVRGEVDAITGFHFSGLLSLNARGVKDEDVVMFKYTDYKVPLYGNVIFASPRFIAEKPQAVAGFLRATNKAIKETIADPAAAIKYLKQRDPVINEEIELRRLKLALDGYIATPGAKSNGLGGFNKLRLEQGLESVMWGFGLKNAVNLDWMINSSFLPPAADRRI
jgi:NitT/TauT family transport system substrate-binding protein